MCCIHITLLISSHLTSSHLTFISDWVAVSWLWNDSVRRGCDQSERSRSRWDELSRSLHSPLTATHSDSVQMNWDDMRWDEMRWVIWTFLYGPFIWQISLHLTWPHLTLSQLTSFHYIRQVNGVKVADILLSLLCVCVCVCAHSVQSSTVCWMKTGLNAHWVLQKSLGGYMHSLSAF